MSVDVISQRMGQEWVRSGIPLCYHTDESYIPQTSQYYVINESILYNGDLKKNSLMYIELKYDYMGHELHIVN